MKILGKKILDALKTVNGGVGMDTAYQILIVDDIKENIDVLNGILKDEYKLKAATRGAIALKIAEKFKPDLILLDVMMPEMDGYEVCQKLKSNPITRNIPVIFVTAKDDDVDEAKGFEVGAVDYISKPVNPMIVKSRVKTQLALSNQRRELAKEVNVRTQELNETRLEVIKILGRASEYKDNETGMHVVRVGEYCYTIAIALGMDEHEAELLRDASPMHDVGKIGIPDHILRKPGKLDKEEWEIMMTHTDMGGDILGSQESELLKMAKVVALEHHEKVDGSGYPNHIEGDTISLQARIVALCDVFDALTSERPYKEPWPIEKAVNLIKEEKGKHFDQQVVEAFLKVLDDIIVIHDTYQE